MPHELRHERSPDYSGRLTVGLAPDGELQFADGVATVESEARAAIDERSAPISYPGATVSDTGEDAADDSDGGSDPDVEDGDDFDAAAFADRTPMGDVVADIESGGYDEHLEAIAAAESEGRDRQGVSDAIAARGE